MSVFAELNPPYSTIVVDPPWRYEVTGQGPSARGVNPVSPIGPRSNGHHGSGLAYASMTLEEVCSLPVSEVAADDARVFLWVTNRYLRHGWSVVEAWGFEPAERVLVWCKPPRGTTPVTTEYVLMGKRGKPPKLPWHGTTWFQWPLQPVHSQKPDAFMDLVEQWCPGPYVELFSRRPRFGWDSWGYGYESVRAS